MFYLADPRTVVYIRVYSVRFTFLCAVSSALFCAEMFKICITSKLIRDALYDRNRPIDVN